MLAFTFMHFTCACFVPGAVHDDKMRKAHRPLPQGDHRLQEAGRLPGDLDESVREQARDVPRAHQGSFLVEGTTKLVSSRRRNVAGVEAGKAWEPCVPRMRGISLENMDKAVARRAE